MPKFFRPQQHHGATDRRKNTLPSVLIVEEQANQARVMAIGLRLEGFEVETAAGSADALLRLAAQPFDGIQLARIVRERHPGTRVVLMSAYHLSERQLARADCGAAGFVPKPLDLGELALFLRGKVQGKPGVLGEFELTAAAGSESRLGCRARPVAGAAASR
jgi:DNA-binding response OmpR family regulator